MANKQQEQFLGYLMALKNEETTAGITELARRHGLNPCVNSILTKGGLLLCVSKGIYRWNPERPQPNLVMVNEVIKRYESYGTTGKKTITPIPSVSLPDQIITLTQERDILAREKKTLENRLILKNEEIESQKVEIDEQKELIAKLRKELRKPWYQRKDNTI